MNILTPCCIDFVPAVNPHLCRGHCCSFFIVDYVTALDWSLKWSNDLKKHIFSHASGIQVCRSMWFYVSEIPLRFLPAQQCGGYRARHQQMFRRNPATILGLCLRLVVLLLWIIHRLSTAFTGTISLTENSSTENRLTTRFADYSWRRGHCFMSLLNFSNVIFNILSTAQKKNQFHLQCISLEVKKMEIDTLKTKLPA